MQGQCAYMQLDPRFNHLTANKKLRESAHGYIMTEEDDNDTQNGSKCVDGKRFRMVHWLDQTHFTPGYSVDHIDFDPKNNRSCNLRYIPMLVNCMRKKSHQSNNKLRGVYETSSGTYVARYSKTYIGTYKSIECAAAAYNKVLAHVYSHHNCMQWYDEIKNEVDPLLDPSVSQHTLKQSVEQRRSPTVRNAGRPMYANIWEDSVPVELDYLGDGLHAVHKIDYQPKCVRCSAEMCKKRSRDWDQAHIQFFKCERCVQRDD